MYEVSVSGWFAAAHQLRLADGSLEPLHGHNWQVVVTFAGPRLDAAGLLIDFTEVRPRLDALLATMHDGNLNDLPAFASRNPSTEHVAAFIADQCANELPPNVVVRCVQVEEAPGCTARFFPNGS